MVLDGYISGDVERISAEAPIPVLRVRRREYKPGNAAFVAAGLRGLGASPRLLSLVGNDREGMRLREMLADLGLQISGLVVDPHRPTILKERLLGSVQSANRATQQLLRVDEEDVWPLCPQIEDELLDKLPEELKGVDGVLIADINKGLVTPRLLRALIDGTRERGLPIVIDPRLSDDFEIYRNATVLTPNRYETERATGISLSDSEAWSAAARILIERLNLEACLITLDRDGMYLMERGRRGVHILSRPREVSDVTGAGDVVLTVFGFFAIGGLDFAAAAGLANIAAGLEVTHQGAEIISREELERCLIPKRGSYESKVMRDDELAQALEQERQEGRQIVFTNGCFDLVHAGHLRTFAFARSLGDVVVGVKNDRSVRELRGPRRPVFSVKDRMRLLAALEMVDYVVSFEETDAERIIRHLRPDVLVKGWDDRDKGIDGRIVESYGGQVAFATLTTYQSSTETVKRVRVTCAEPPPRRAVRQPWKRR